MGNLLSQQNRIPQSSRECLGIGSDELEEEFDLRKKSIENFEMIYHQFDFAIVKTDYTDRIIKQKLVGELNDYLGGKLLYISEDEAWAEGMCHLYSDQFPLPGNILIQDLKSNGHPLAKLIEGGCVVSEGSPYLLINCLRFLEYCEHCNERNVYAVETVEINGKTACIVKVDTESG